MGWWRRDGADLVLQVEIQPRASTDVIAGVMDGRLKIRLTAPPVEGRANEQLIAFLARAFRVPKGSVILERGDASKRKQLRVCSPKKLPQELDGDPK